MKKSGADEIKGKFVQKIVTKSVHILGMEISNLQWFDR